MVCGTSMSGCAYFGDDGRGCASDAGDVDRLGRQANLERHAVRRRDARGHARAVERARERLCRREQAGSRLATRSRRCAVGHRDAEAGEPLESRPSTVRSGPAGISNRNCRVIAGAPLAPAARGSSAASRRERRSAATRAVRVSSAPSTGAARRGASAAEATNAPMTRPTRIGISCCGACDVVLRAIANSPSIAGGDDSAAATIGEPDGHAPRV